MLTHNTICSSLSVSSSFARLVTDAAQQHFEMVVDTLFGQKDPLQVTFSYSLIPHNGVVFEDAVTPVQN